MLKRIIVPAVLLLLVVAHRPAYALMDNASLKGALVEYLYQYGKETFYRGVNPQEASFILQRALVLDCHHRGAQFFLEKLHSKYPDVSVRVWGCPNEPEVAAEEPAMSLRSARTAVTGKLPDEEAKARAIEREAARTDAQMSESVGRGYEEEPESVAAAPVQETPRPRASAAVEDKPEDVSYSNIANDQNDLIRIQQGNIDYLKNELAEAKKQMKTGTASVDTYTKNQLDVASSGLDAEEQKMATAEKNQEARDLRQRLNDLQEQLALVQKIVDEKNRTIESLQKELKPARP